MLNIFLILTVLLFCPRDIFAEIYKCSDENGKTYFSAKPAAGCTLLPGSLPEAGENNPSEAPPIETEAYKDTQGYKDYLKLPAKYRSPAMEEIFKNGYEAEQKVKNLPSVKGGTVGQLLDKKAGVPAVEDLGWNTRSYQGGFEVERVLLLGKMKLVYRWSVESNGIVKAINGKAMGITK